MLSKSTAVFVVGMGLFVGAAQAQNASPNSIKWVDVNVSKVANELANNLKVDVGKIPAVVQVPVKIAATVCGVEENVLAKPAPAGNTPGNAQCAAKTASRALNEIVQTKIGKT